MRFFGVLPKLPKVELTMRTPYRTFFENFNNFSRVYVNTTKGLIAIGNRSIPRVYLLPPGEINIKNIIKSKSSNITQHTINNLSGAISLKILMGFYGFLIKLFICFLGER